MSFVGLWVSGLAHLLFDFLLRNRGFGTVFSVVLLDTHCPLLLLHGKNGFRPAGHAPGPLAEPAHGFR